MMARRQGTFPAGHELAGQRRVLVLEGTSLSKLLTAVNEHLTSQTPSCCYTICGVTPNRGCSPQDRLVQVGQIFQVKHCPHCLRYWNRDVNACYCIRVIYLYLKHTGRRLRVFGPPKEGEERELPPDVPEGPVDPGEPEEP